MIPNGAMARTEKKKIVSAKILPDRFNTRALLCSRKC